MGEVAWIIQVGPVWSQRSCKWKRKTEKRGPVGMAI